MCISSVPQWNELQILFSKLILKALVNTFHMSAYMRDSVKI